MSRPKTPEQKARSAQRQREWKIKNREWHLESRSRYNRLKEYGLTHEQFIAMRAAQNECCACCGVKLEERGPQGMHVDHDHTTGKVRGLLCASCNLALGMVKENVETLLKLGVYIEKHRG